MAFCLFVAADVAGQKVNLELPFLQRPSLTELQQLVEVTFSSESYTPFRVASFHIYNDDPASRGWEVLSTPSALSEFSQLYATQHGVAESPQSIPSPRAPRNSGQRRSASYTRTEASIPVPARRLASGSPPLQSAMVSTAALLRAAAPPASSHSYQQLELSPPPHRTSALLKGAQKSLYGQGEQQQPVSAIDILNAQVPTASPEALSSLVTVKQRLFADPNPTVDHKVRTVFDELDTNHVRRIDLEEFRRSLSNLRLDIPDTIFSDLFFRADRDRDSALSYAEFEWLAGYYPTLVDSLYFRMKEAYEERRRREGIEKKRLAVQEELQREAGATIAGRDIRRRIEELESSLLLHEQELKGKAIREKDCQHKLSESKKETEAQKQHRQQREDDVASAKENEKARHKNLLESQRAVESAQRKVAELESELSRAQEKESQLEKLLEAARKETDRSRKSLQSGVEEARKWRDHEAQQGELFTESQRDVQKFVSVVTAADEELEALQKLTAASEEQLLAAQRETALAAHRRDQQDKALLEEHERDAQLHQALGAVNAALERARLGFESAEKELAEYRQRRQRIEAQEKPLIDEEIRLREQRFQLEEHESRFRHDTVSFYHTAGRPVNTSSPMHHSISRGYSYLAAHNTSNAIAAAGQTSSALNSTSNIMPPSGQAAVAAASNASLAGPYQLPYSSPAPSQFRGGLADGRY